MSDYLASEWKPALGCTEPAAVAWAAAKAAGTSEGPIEEVRLICDPRIYKNCYAVGLPNSEGKTGILWALAIGSNLMDGSLGLHSFDATNQESLACAQRLLESHAVHVEVDAKRTDLFIDVRVKRAKGIGRAVIEHEHENLTHIEHYPADHTWSSQTPTDVAPKAVNVRSRLAALGIKGAIDMALSLTKEDRRFLREGAMLNMEIARFGTSLLPEKVVNKPGVSAQDRVAQHVQAGVTARMSGVSQTVMTLAGSGNKGITVSLPIWLWGLEHGHPGERVEEALALGCLITSATTHHLGTLSAACGSAIAAGAGIAAGLVHLDGGGAHEVGLAVSNVVGTLAGMICDGAKVGCAMKTLTGVEAAFRAASYAMAGEGIPATNGIVGKDGETSLVYLGLVVTKGMANVDAEILEIMQRKLGVAQID